MLTYAQVQWMRKQAADPVPKMRVQQDVHPSPYQMTRGELSTIIQKGDSLASLGKKWDVSVPRLKAFNPGVKANALRIGAPLSIPLTDRDQFYQDNKFDYMDVPKLPDNIMQNLFWVESTNGKFLTNPTSTASGYAHMTTPTFNETKAYDPSLKNYVKADLNRPDVATKFVNSYIAKLSQDWQKKHGRRITVAEQLGLYNQGMGGWNNPAAQAYAKKVLEWK